MKHVLPSLRAAILRSQAQPQTRFYSQSAGLRPSQQQPSFYKTFSRPIFKVALMAIFTYQLAFYAWTKLETDEIRADAAATIADLEKRIEVLEQSKAGKSKK
ncbi:putative Inner membrane assembly complex subunit 17 [Seiridium unicorne]|uniref:Inner membrane assembly complex subunit 17 n=1 Tax=Seiridium unicorne TaxID=138068 RepID=A0ABR2UIY7_9PEZI